MEAATTLRAVEHRHDYDRVFREGAPVLWRALYAYSAGRADVADDALAEAFARAIERDGQVRDPLPWIYRTAFRLAAAELKRTRTSEAPPDQISAPTQPELMDVTSALRQLSPNQRAAVFLHYRADLPVHEISKLMGISAATVRVHLFQGRKRLRTILGDEEVDDD